MMLSPRAVMESPLASTDALVEKRSDESMDDATPAPVAKRPRTRARADAAKSTASEAFQAAQDKAQELRLAAVRAEAEAARLAKVATEVRAAADAAQTKAEEISQKAAVAERVTTAEGRAALKQDKLAETKHRVPPRALPASAQPLQAVRRRAVGKQTGAPPAEAPVPPPQPHPQKRPASQARQRKHPRVECIGWKQLQEGAEGAIQQDCVFSTVIPGAKVETAGMTVDEEHLKQPKGKTHAQNRSAFLHSAVYAGHDLWQTGVVVWCKRCGHYCASKGIMQLTEECRGWMPPSRAKSVAKLEAGRAPKALLSDPPLGQVAALTSADMAKIAKKPWASGLRKRREKDASAKTPLPAELDEQDLGPGED